MGNEESKIVNPKANVINEITVMHEDHELFVIEICLVLISILMCLNLAMNIYSMHNKRLKKRYLSRGNSLDKI